MMHVLVLGAGVVGVSSAYQLAKQGCRVTLIDRAEQAGMGSSYANGGQLSYRYRTPIANPGVLLQLPKILLGLDPAFKIYPSKDLSFYQWCLRYLLSAMPSASQHSAQVMKALGAMAKGVLSEAVRETNIQFDYRSQAGKLYLLYEEAAMAKAQIDECTELWPREKLLKLLPSLNANSNMVGALYDKDEEAGDCRQFCLQLLAFMQANFNVSFVSGANIQSLKVSNQKIAGVVTDKGLVEGDAYVLTMGPQSAALAKTIGIKLPIYPMKGYSVTVPAKGACSDISITDYKTKTVYCKLGERLRIAGFAEFSGYSTEVKQSRIRCLLNNARSLLPEAGDYDQVLDAWCGLRPATPDSLPIVDQSIYSNLYLNVGHGMLGWTYAMAAADIIARIILSHENKLDCSYLSLSRF